MTIESGYQEFKPTIWHRLGFGHAGVSDWDEKDMPEGAITTDVVVVLGAADRLRILITGRLHVAIRTKTERVVDRAISKSAVKVLGWGWQR
jgi:hypothetical protein